VSGSPLVVHARGAALLADPLTNKGTAFTAAERDALDLDGLLPPAVCSMAQQLDRVYQSFQRKQTPLERYIYLAALQDRNETLFYRLVHEHIDELMPIVYTPVVGEACQQFSHIFRRPRGLFISYEQRHQIDRILRNHARPPAVIVVTDGERILGLGDQGVGGMGIPTGKLSLYTAGAGIPPELTLPIVLDVGTDNEALLNDPMYLGMRHRRVRGADYQAFIDQFVASVIRVFPGAVLQWEDFLKENAITQLARFRDRLCTFNDDIQGTAATVLAGVYTAMRVTGIPMNAQRMVLAGAGASAQGIAGLFVSALIEAGRSPEDARRRVCTVDSRGLVTQGRRGLEPFKALYARPEDEVRTYACADAARVSLEETVRNFKPTLLIGASGTPALFTESVVRAMASIAERPVIFPLSNPTSKSECTADEAVRWSDGRAIVATGSPFAPVEYGGTRRRIGQSNNSFIFPGIGLGLWAGRVKRVTDGMFLDAASALAAQVTPGDLEEGSVYPALTRIRACSLAVACAVVRRAIREGMTDLRIDEVCLADRVSKAMWVPAYRPFVYEPAADAALAR
jgi:malate dehydrogenase (oxaloacetate-decarboxylating)